MTGRKINFIAGKRDKTAKHKSTQNENPSKNILDKAYLQATHRIQVLHIHETVTNFEGLDSLLPELFFNKINKLLANFIQRYNLLSPSNLTLNVNEDMHMFVTCQPNCKLH